MVSQHLNSTTHRVSIVVPVYNERENIAPLLKRVHDAMEKFRYPWELIVVDDGSIDDSSMRLADEREKYGPHVRALYLQRNFGQTAAMQSGIDAARGDVIVTIDGDLQNDPTDIPRLVSRLIDEDLDLVVGWRKERKDDLLLRKIPSRIANRLIARVTGVRLHDYGCSLKAYRASVIKNVRLYGQMHRFIPAWVATKTQPHRIKEEVVTHHAREMGESKYGIMRTFNVVFDLLSVYFFMRYNARPGHFFGKLGFVCGTLGGGILFYLFSVKILGEDIGGRHLLLVGVVLMVAALQFLTTGILGEVMSRTYYETSTGKAYSVRNEGELYVADHEGWNATAGEIRKFVKRKKAAAVETKRNAHARRQPVEKVLQHAAREN